MANAAKVKYLSFSMEDRPGLLAEITGKLSEAKVNIGAVCGYAWDSTAYFDILVDNVPKAKKALSGLGVTPEIDEALTVELPNKPGALDKAAKALADAGINIEYLYGTTTTGRTATGFLSTSDNNKALRVLKKV